MAKNNYAELAKEILADVGGAENVTFCTHCMTRLRFNLSDQSKAEVEKIKALSGVVGAQWSGDQLQIIIGPTVKNVYGEVTKLGSFKEGKEKAAQKEKLTLKGVGNAVLNYVSGSMVGIIPVMIAGGMMMTFNVIFGPSMLNLYSDTSNTYIFLNFLYEAGFYFMPILLGYSAAKKLKIDPIYGIYLGCLLLTPSLVSLVNAGEAFEVFGIRMPLVDYSQSMMPILLSAWILSIVHKYVVKYVPDILASVFVPLLTMLIMLPLTLFILAPLGSVLSAYVAAIMAWFGNTFGVLATALISGLWILLVTTGMHGAVIMAFLPVFFETGVEYNVMPALWTYTMATYGIGIAAAIMLKKKEEKSLATGYLVANVLGGVAEPTIFGLIFKYKRLLVCQIVGGLAGGLYIGLTHVGVFTMGGSSNFMMALTFAAGGTANLVNALIGGLISLGVTVVMGCLWGLNGEKAQTPA